MYRARMDRAAPMIYIASPLGFADSTRRYYETVLLPELARAGYAPLDPWDNAHPAVAPAFAAVEQDATLERLGVLNEAIGRRNVELLQQADAVLAVLDGVDVDSGTAAEIGFAAARGTPIVGLRTDLRQSGENDAAPVNLQVAYFVAASGGRIVDGLEPALAALRELVPAAV